MAGNSSDDSRSNENQSLQIGREEGRATISEQVQNLRNIDSKAAKLLRLNLIIISVAPSILSLAVQTTDSLNISIFINNYTVFGLLCLLLSTGLAALTYTSSDLQTGVGNDDLQQILEGDYEEEVVLEGLVDAYGDWIEFNTQTTIRNAPYVTLTVLLVVAAITSFSLGLLEAASSVPIYADLLAIGGFIILAKLAGLPRQISRWRKEVEPIRSIRMWMREKTEIISDWQP